MQANQWSCSTLFDTARHMHFCRNAINYDPALPVAANTKKAVQKQDSEAMTIYVYHMSGIGREPWEFDKPDRTNDDCVRTIWKMACYTAFPRSQIGCQAGAPTQYIRPCKSCCQNYIRACGVECCDESVRCVFEHNKTISRTETIFTAGYMPHDGPSSLCTGGAHSSASPGILSFLLLLFTMLWACDATAPPIQPISWHQVARPLKVALTAVLLAGTTCILQGCDDVPSHKVGNWRAMPDYLVTFQFVPPGQSARNAMINSCNFDGMSPATQCSGRGVCKNWDETLDNPTSFCMCERDWADPECRTKRKSQTQAFFWGLFLGMFGADHFYLGLWKSGLVKLFTLGGFGSWWIFDIVRIGSAPVHAADYLVAADLPHYIFVLLVITLAMIVGFLMSYLILLKHQLNKRKEAMLQREEAEARIRGLDTNKLPHKQRHPVLAVGEPGMKLHAQGGIRQNMEPTGGQFSARQNMEPMGGQFRQNMEPTGFRPPQTMMQQPIPTEPEIMTRSQRPNFGSQPNYGSIEVEGVGRDNVTQVLVPRGAMGTPRTVMDGGKLLTALDHNHDGQIDNLEAQQLAQGAAVVATGEFETRNSRAGMTSSMVRSQGVLQPSQLLSSEGPRPARSGSLGAASRPPATASCAFASPPMSSANMPATSAGSLTGNGGFYGPAASVGRLSPDRVQRSNTGGMSADPPLLQIHTASSMRSQYPPASYKELNFVPPSGVMALR